MEDTHGGLKSQCTKGYIGSLNPYCNGRYSWSTKTLAMTAKEEVLILIVMEDTHGVYHHVYNPKGLTES